MIVAMAQPPGGGRRFNEDSFRIAGILMALIVLIFFALVIRSHFDKERPPLKPVRGLAGLFRKQR